MGWTLNYALCQLYVVVCVVCVDEVCCYCTMFSSFCLWKWTVYTNVFVKTIDHSKRYSSCNKLFIYEKMFYSLTVNSRYQQTAFRMMDLNRHSSSFDSRMHLFQWTPPQLSCVWVSFYKQVWGNHLYNRKHPLWITQRFCVLCLQSNTTIFHLVQWENTTTCFGPIGGPSSGCNLEISYTRCVCVGGTRSRYCNIGCHDLGGDTPQNYPTSSVTGLR